MKTSTTIKTLACLLGICLLGAACNRTTNPEATRPRGATVSEVKNRFREPYMQLRMRFAEIARGLPPVGSVRNQVGAATARGQRANLNPLPTAENTGFAAAEQLLDPGRGLPYDFFDLNLSGCPVQCFQWLTSTPASDDEDRNGDMARGFEMGLARRYLVIYRAARYVRPQVTVAESSPGGGIGSMRYTPGSIDLEVLTFDLQSNAVVDSFRVSGTTPNQVRFSNRSDASAQDRERAMLGTVEGQLRNDMRASVFAGLTERTGRTFDPPANAISSRQ